VNRTAHAAGWWKSSIFSVFVFVCLSGFWRVCDNVIGRPSNLKKCMMPLDKRRFVESLQNVGFTTWHGRAHRRLTCKCHFPWYVNGCGYRAGRGLCKILIHVCAILFLASHDAPVSMWNIREGLIVGPIFHAIQCTLVPPGEYNRSICVATKMRPVLPLL